MIDWSVTACHARPKLVYPELKSDANEANLDPTPACQFLDAPRLIRANHTHIRTHTHTHTRAKDCLLKCSMLLVVLQTCASAWCQRPSCYSLKKKRMSLELEATFSERWSRIRVCS